MLATEQFISTPSIYVYCLQVASFSLLAFYTVRPVHTQMAEAKVPTANQKQKVTFTHRQRSHQGLFGVRYLAQGHSHMQTGETEDRAASLPIIGRPP